MLHHFFRSPEFTNQTLTLVTAGSPAGLEGDGEAVLMSLTDHFHHSFHQQHFLNQIKGVSYDDKTMMMKIYNFTAA